MSLHMAATSPILASFELPYYLWNKINQLRHDWAIQADREFESLGDFYDGLIVDHPEYFVIWDSESDQFTNILYTGDFFD